jgi:hypothetical protein
LQSWVDSLGCKLYCALPITAPAQLYSIPDREYSHLERARRRGGQRRKTLCTALSMPRP